MGSSLTSVRINRAFFSHSDLFLSPRKRLLGDDNTLSSEVFLNRVNNSVPGRYGFMFKTAPETSASKCWILIKIEIAMLRFFLHTVIRPNE